MWVAEVSVAPDWSAEAAEGAQSWTAQGAVTSSDSADDAVTSTWVPEVSASGSWS